MSYYEDENTAIVLLGKLKDRVVRLDSSVPDPELANQTGRFELLEDMNCCAPTDQILVAFQMPHSRKVMDASTFLKLADQIASGF